MRFRQLGKMRLLEVWVVKLLIKRLIILIFSSNLPIEVVSSISSFLGYHLDETFQAITVLDLLFDVVCGMNPKSLLLLEDQICEFLQLCFHPLKLGNIILNAVLREIVLLAKVLKSLRVGVGGDLVGNREVCLDVHDFHRP